MHKRIALALAVFMTGVSVAQAATLTSAGFNKLYLNESKELNPITITSESDGDIKAVRGINILLDQDQWILWDKVESVTFQGDAVQKGLVEASVAPSYENGYKVVHVAVKADWTAGASATLSGLRARGYSHAVPVTHVLGFDLNGDYVADVQDINATYVSNAETRTDVSAPYPPTGLQYSVSPAKDKITLQWTDPPDYDFASSSVSRTLTRGGVTGGENIVVSDTVLATYTDNDVKANDIIVYKVIARDQGRQSDPVTVTVDLNAVSAPEPTPTPTPTPTPGDSDSGATPSETAELTRLFGYYKIRYQIKCKPSGRVVSESDSACLWASIDLVYAQEKLGKSDVQVSLSARALSLIESRLQYSQARYDEHCTGAQTESYCPALGKALSRATYFLSQ